MAPEPFILQASDGLQLAAYEWAARPDRPTEGVVVLVHGMGEHIRRYDHVADELTAAGFRVYGYDHRGHGCSRVGDAEYGDLGPHGWEALVADIGAAVAEARRRNPGSPVTVIAHSMGSFATQQFLAWGAPDLDAVVLTGTAALDQIEPLIDPSTDIDLSSFNAAFTPARTAFDWLSRDEARVDAYVADVACGSGLDPKSAKSMFAGASRIVDATALSDVPRQLPIYVAVGSMDPVNGGLTFLWPLVDRMRAVGIEDVTVRVYDGARHELFNETNRSEVLDDLVGWIRRATVENTAGSSTSATTDEGE